MLRFYKLVFSIISISLSFSVSCNPKNYFGIDGHILNTKFEQNFGGNLLKKTTPGASGFIGLKLNDIFSLELGYSHSAGSRVSTLHLGEYSAGQQVVLPIAPATFKSKTIIKGPYLNIIANSQQLEKVPVQFFVGGGISYSVAIFKRKALHISGIAWDRGYRRIESHRTLFNYTTGANYFFNENFAIRATLSFLNTKKLTAFGCNGYGECCDPSQISPKNSVRYGLGLRWGF